MTTEVALVGSVQEAWNTAGQATLTLPAGSAAGHMAIVAADRSDNYSMPMPSGWISAWPGLRWKILTAADITAATVLVHADLTGLVVLSGAAGFGLRSDSSTVNVHSASGAAFWRGRTDPYRSSLAAATYRIGTEATSPIDQHHNGLYLRIATAVGYYSLDGVNPLADFAGWEILPPTTPLAPVLVTPATGTQINRTIANTLTVAHQSVSGLPQEKVRLVIRPAAGTWVSVKADGTLHTDDTWELTQSSGVVTIAANALTAGTQYEWGAYTMDATGWSPVATTRTVVARTPPTVAVTLTATAGDLSPVVSWTTTPGTGSQTAYEARICAAADTTPDNPVAYTSGMVAGTDADWTPAPSLAYVNGGSYKAWVRVADAALTSAWTASAADTVSWTAPTAPSGVTFQQGAPSTVTVAGIAAGADTVEVQWSLDGTTWETIATVVPTGTSLVLPVPNAGYGVSRQYRARITDVVETFSLPSAWATIATPAASADKGAYLVAATDCTDYLAVRVRSDSRRTPLEGVTTSTGLGALSARVDYTPSAGWSGETTVGARTVAEEVALHAWWAAHKVAYWMVWNPEREGSTYVNRPPMLIARASGVSPERLAQVAIAHRDITFSWVTQQSPESVSATVDSDFGYDIVILAGQSNMSGSGSPLLVATLDAGDPRIFQYAASGPGEGTIIPGIDPLENPAPDASSEVGPGMQFAREWLNNISTTRDVLLVPTAIGGSSLVGNAWAVGGTYYAQTVTLANAAFAAAGDGARVVAILWAQGEGDAVGNVTEGAYAAALDAVITGWRSSIIGASATPFVLGSMVPEWRTTPHGTSLAIHAAHVATPSRLANTYFVDGPTGHSEDTDGIHFDAAACRTIGGLMAAAVASAPPAPVASAYTVAVMSDTPLVYLPLGESSPPPIDVKYATTPTVTGTVTFGAGGIGDRSLAADFGGGRVDLGTPTVLNNFSAFTVEALIQPDVLGDSFIAVRDDGDNARTWRFATTSADKVEFYKFTNGVSNALGSTVLSSGVPYHVAATYDGTYLRVYVNGAQDGISSATSGTLSSPMPSTTLGASSAGTFAYNGRMAGVAIYGSALSAGRILAHAQAAGLGG